MNKLIFYLVICMIIIPNASAISISNIDFGEVEAGKTYSKRFALTEKRYDNVTFLLKIEDKYKEWFEIYPNKTTLKKNVPYYIEIKLDVSENAFPIEYSPKLSIESKEPIIKNLEYKIKLEQNIKLKIKDKTAINQKTYDIAKYLFFIIVSLLIIFLGYEKYHEHKKILKSKKNIRKKKNTNIIEFIFDELKKGTAKRTILSELKKKRIDENTIEKISINMDILNQNLPRSKYTKEKIYGLMLKINQLMDLNLNKNQIVRKIKRWDKELIENLYHKILLFRLEFE